jgi:hypothetical protein
MALCALLLGECLSAGGAGVRLLPRMDPKVDLEIALYPERLVTIGTRKGLLTRVQRLVP